MSVRLPFLTSTNFTGLVNDRFWQNTLPIPATNPLSNGQLVPDVELLWVQEQKSLRLSSIWTQQPVILALTRIFTEHQYCPLCFPHIQALNAAYEDFQGKGVEVLLVTSTDPVQSQTIAQDLDLKLPLLSDPTCKAFRLYQTGQALGAPLPAQFLIDKEGKLRYKHLFSFLDDNASVDRLKAEVATLA
ncbi:redoxin domain-containing protein [Candidatus Synechococcus calcipolaris G9]|uniref:Redoxin domain-containing protein n=1 Tax=Candidatus Synechococcus calcipolaris G9 TaxID=1497997 RepID=A0ABT6F3B8_9SYNE|nr:redoxin domain-containing protein [Candidatus Synechococcus calcipolaris]MDG2992364.1 redoxin domain-containing protein [Candidatus Synechococcus calcipolaris G9]